MTMQKTKRALVTNPALVILGAGLSASAATGRSLLVAVQQFGTDVQMGADGTITGGTSLPAEEFTYREQGVN
jgi:hypothetical protein